MRLEKLLPDIVDAVAPRAIRPHFGRPGLRCPRIERKMLDMLVLAACLLGAAAAGGLFMAVRIFTKSDAPLSVALLHGAAAAAGLVTLLITVLSSGGFGAPGLALAVLGAAALGGFFLFSFHLRKRPWPTPVVVVHAVVAVTGFAILLYAILTAAS